MVHTHFSPSGKVTMSPASNDTGSPPSGVTVAAPARMKQVSCSSYCQGKVDSSFSQIGHADTPRRESFAGGGFRSTRIFMVILGGAPCLSATGHGAPSPPPPTRSSCAWRAQYSSDYDARHADETPREGGAVPGPAGH